jgi:hypothetical protein
VPGFGLSEEDCHFSIPDGTRNTKGRIMNDGKFAGWRKSSYSDDGNS